MAAEHALLVGARIREAREAKNLTQRELADQIPGKADGNQVSKWERGTNLVSVQTLEHIGRITEHDLAWFHTFDQPVELGEAQEAGLSQLGRIEAKLDRVILSLAAAGISSPDAGAGLPDLPPGLERRLQGARPDQPDQRLADTG